MFSCCFRASRGSSLKKEQSECHGGVWRRRVYSCLRRFWPFTWKKRNLNQGSQGHDCNNQGEQEFATANLEEPCREPHISAEIVEKLASHLVPSLQIGDPFIIPTFLYIYQMFANTQQVLDLLFRRYDNFQPYCEVDEEVSNIICTFLDAWMDKNPAEFYQTSDLSILKNLKTYLIVNLPYSDLLVHVHMLQTHLLKEEASDSESDDDKDPHPGSHTTSDSEIEV